MKEPWRYVRQSFFSIIECIDSLIKLAEKCNYSLIKLARNLVFRPEKCNFADIIRQKYETIIRIIKT